MKQKSEKTVTQKSGDQMICHSWISFMWHLVQFSAPMLCQIIEKRNRLSGCKDTKFSRHTIKKGQLSVHIYNNVRATSQPRGPNYTLKSSL
jgi:hypothetical protein